MRDKDALARSRRAAVLQIAAEELRSTDRGSNTHEGGRLARVLDKLAAALLVQRPVASSS